MLWKKMILKGNIKITHTHTHTHAHKCWKTISLKPSFGLSFAIWSRLARSVCCNWVYKLSFFQFHFRKESLAYDRLLHKQLLWGALLKKVFLEFQPSTLLKKRLWYRCFPANFAKFLRTTLVAASETRCTYAWNHFMRSNNTKVHNVLKNEYEQVQHLNLFCYKIFAYYSLCMYTRDWEVTTWGITTAKYKVMYLF